MLVNILVTVASYFEVIFLSMYNVYVSHMTLIYESHIYVMSYMKSTFNKCELSYINLLNSFISALYTCLLIVNTFN